MIRIRSSAWYFALAALAGVSLTVWNAGAACEPEFPLKDGWLGGDAVYSVSVSSERTIWLFGDTFIGRSKSARQRRESAMVANTVAVSTCRNGQWSVDYAWKGSHRAPAPFFEPGHEGEHFWPMDGFVHEGAVHIFLARLSKNTQNGGAFGFRYLGVTLVRIENPEEPPSRWRIGYRELTTDATAFPGAAAVVDGKFVYAYTVLDDEAHKADHPMILTRIPLDALGAAPADSLETLGASGEWLPGLRWREARVVMPRGATEMSVKRAPGGDGWIAVYPPSGIFPDHFVSRRAPSLEGPWAEAKKLFTYPEMDPSRPGYDRETFCYAAKEHPAFRGGDTLLVTYACNNLDFGKLVEDTGIYRPQVVRIPAFRWR